MTSPASPGTTRALNGFVAGLVAGSALVALSLAAKVIAGVPTLPELGQDRLIQSVPGPVFAFMLRRLLYLGKPALFISLLALEVVVLGAGGIAAFRWHKPVVIAVVLWLLVGFIVLPVLGRGVFDGRFDVAWTSLAAFGAYAFVLLLLDPEREKQPSPEPAGLPWS